MRPRLLRRLLAALEQQETDGLFTYSIIVADNDQLQSAERLVARFASRCSIATTYCVEPQQNIALARNKALEHAKGDFVAFIDDDEFPAKDWLRNLLMTCDNWGTDGVLGPVKPYFVEEPPSWVTRGRFFERPTYDTGHKMDWREARTGNLLLRRQILNGTNSVFRPEFGTGGEDVDFFRRMMEKGRLFIWCNEAIVHEVVPPARCNRCYLLRKALLRGRNSLKQSACRVRNLLKSFVAVPLYALALPFLFLAGHHIAIRYMIKLCDHAGRILALFSLNPVTERPLTD